MNTKVVLAVAALCLFQGVIALPNFVDVVLEYKTSINDLKQNVDKLAEDKILNIGLATQELNGLASEAQLHVEHQLQSLQSSTKKFDSCAAVKNAAMSEINTVNVDSCKESAKWEIVNNEINVLKQIKTSITNLPGTCMGVNAATAEKVRACIEEGLASLETEISKKDKEISGATTQQKLLASICINMVKAKVSTLVKDTMAEFDTCNQEKVETETYLDVVAEFVPQVEQLNEKLAHDISVLRSNIALAAIDLDKIVSQTDAFLEHQMSSVMLASESSSSSNKDISDCTINQKEALGNTENFNSCKNVVNWDSVNDDLKTMQQLESKIKQISDVCVSRSTVNLKFIRACIEEGLTQTENTFVSLKEKINNAIVSQKFLVSMCITSTKIRITTQFEDIIAEYSLCVDETEALKYEDIIASAEKEINLVKSNIAAIETDTEKNLKMAVSLIEFSFLTSNAHVKEQLKQLEEVVKASDDQPCIESQQIALEKVPTNAINLCKEVPTLNLNKVQSKLEQIKEIETEMSTVVRSCLGTDQSFGLGAVNVDITLGSLNNCIKTSIKKVSANVNTISNEILEIIEASTKAANDCATRNKNTIVSSLKEISEEFNTCTENNEGEIYLDVIGEYQPQIEQFNEKLSHDISVLRSNIALSELALNKLVSETDVFLQNQMSSVMSLTSSDKKIDDCIVNQKQALANTENFDSCKSVVNWDSVNDDLKTMQQLQSKVNQISDVCVSRSKVNLKFIRACIEESLAQTKSNVASLNDNINKVIVGQKFLVSMCITSTKLRITTQFEDIIAEYSMCVDESEALEYNDIITSAEKEINLVKSNIAAIQGETSNNLNMALSIIEFTFQTSNAHVNKELAQLEQVLKASDDQKCMESQQIALEKVPTNAINMCKAVPTLNLNKVQSKLEEIKETETELSTVVRSCLGADQTHGLGLVQVEITLGSLNNCIQSSIKEVSGKVNTISSEILEIIKESTQAAKDCATRNKNTIVSSLKEISEEFNSCTKNTDVSTQTLEEVFEELTPKVDETAETITNILIEASKTVTEIHSNVNKIVSSGAAKINQLSSATKAQSIKAEAVIGCIKQQEVAFNKLDTKPLQLCRNQDTQLESLGQNLGEIANVQAKVGLSFGLCAKQYNLKANEVKSCIESYLSNSVSFANNYFESIKAQIGRSTLITNICVSNQSGELTRALNEIAANYQTCATSQ